ncbi:MAG: acyl carrier protein [Bacteroidota bacterium]|nr:acyl carrier protein [Bacteroidota bacterium]MDP4192472.1 acyl carrier protein [Bacteroidota bacterium]MDP4196710.1 acyl carrier protein [Bacteroidota bacterium]
MISEKLKNTIISSLDIDDFDLKDDTTADEVPGWDSLSHVNVILDIEKEFKIRFKSIEVLKLKNIGDLQKLVDSKLNSTN